MEEPLHLTLDHSFTLRLYSITAFAAPNLAHFSLTNSSQQAPPVAIASQNVLYHDL